MKKHFVNIYRKIFRYKKRILLVLILMCISATAFLSTKAVVKSVERYDNLNDAQIGMVNDTEFTTVPEYLDSSKEAHTVELENGQELTQKYKIVRKETSEIFIYTSNQNSSGVVKVLLSKQGSVIFTQEIALAEIRDVIHLPITGFDYPLGTILQLSISVEGMEENTVLTLLTHENREVGYSITGKEELHANGAVLTKTMGNSVFYHTKIIGVCSLVSILLLIGLLLNISNDSIRCKEYLEKSAMKLEKTHMIFPLEFIVSIGLVFLFLRFSIHYFNFQEIHLVLFLMMLVYISIFSVFLIYFFKRYKNDWAKLFLLVVIPLGIFFLVLLLPDSIPDEPVHFYKTVLTSNLDYSMNTVVELPSNYIERGIANYNEYWNQLFTHNNYTSDLITARPVQYSFLLYIIPSIGVMIAKLLSLSIYMAYLFARMCNFIMFLTLGYHAIKLTPYGKVLFFVLLVNPMMIHQGISVSADVLINAISILFIAYVLHIKFRDKPLCNRDLIFLVLFIAFTLIAKYAYLPLVGLVLIFYDKIKVLDKKRVALFFVGCGGAVLLYLILGKLTQVGGPPLVHLPDTVINPSEQVKYLLSNPLNTLNMFVNTLVIKGNFYFFSYFGAYLSWLDLHIPMAIIYLYIFLFISSSFLFEEEKKFKTSNKVWMSILGIGLLLILVLGLYLTWSPVGSAFSEGVQGRYFLPFAILVLLILSGKKRIIISNPQLYVVGITVLVNIVVILNIFKFMMNV